MRTICLDGSYFKVSNQIIEAFTPGTFKAKGVFETMLGLDGVVLDLHAHLKRLRQGLKTLRIKLPLLKQSIFKDTLVRNKLSCARVRLMVWQSGREVHMMVVALPYKISNKKNYRACLIKTRRPANARLSHVKSLDYELFAQAYTLAQANGFDEAFLMNRSGHIFEASRANIFWIKDKVLYTTPLSSGCLNGITRQQVIKQAKNLNISVKEKNLTPEMLKECQGVFLTNSLVGIKPVEFTHVLF